MLLLLRQKLSQDKALVTQKGCLEDPERGHTQVNKTGRQAQSYLKASPRLNPQRHQKRFVCV